MIKKIILILVLLVLVIGCAPPKILEEGLIEEETKVDDRINEPSETPPKQTEKTTGWDVKTEVPEKKTEEQEEVCLTNEEYAEVTDLKGILSMPFKLEDYYPKHWGIVPFCAQLLHSQQVHGAIDFELKPNAIVFAATDGVVENTQTGKEEGSGEVISVRGDGFDLDYSGLTNLQVKVGDKIKKGDYIANVVLIPHGEYHVHMGITINGRQECPLKYMDKEFKDAFEEMFAQADYQSQTDAPCACNCEYMISNT